MSIDVTVETAIGRSRAEVAAYVVDPANEPAWIKGIVTSTPLAEGPIGVGSRVRRLARFMGRQVDYTPEVIEFEPDTRLVMKTDKPFPMTIRYHFLDSESGTIFRQRLLGGPGGVMGLLSPLMAAMVRRSIKGDMERLRGLLERQASESNSGP